jgi:hypothetical protein
MTQINRPNGPRVIPQLTDTAPASGTRQPVHRMSIFDILFRSTAILSTKKYQAGIQV